MLTIRFPKIVKVSALSLAISIFLCNIAETQEPKPNLVKRLKDVKSAITKGKQNSAILDKKANLLNSEVSSLRKKKVKIAEKLKNAESNVFRLRSEITKLTKRELRIQELLDDRKSQNIQILFALHRISKLHPQTIIGYPSSASNLIKTGILLKRAVPEIERRSRQLHADLKLLDYTRSEKARKKTRLNLAVKELDSHRHNLDKLLIRKSKSYKQTLAARQVEASRLHRLSQEVSTLKELFKKLNLEKTSHKQLIRKKRKYTKTNNSLPRRLDPPSINNNRSLELPPIASARGKLIFPVAGIIKSQTSSKKQKKKTKGGLKIISGPGAQVVAPYDGRVVFAGPFRGYGKLLIIEHGQGYHSLLSGLGKIQTTVGQNLISGEPIAAMGAPPTGKPILYMELRKNGKSLNPAPWLSKRKG